MYTDVYTYNIYTYTQTHSTNAVRRVRRHYGLLTADSKEHHDAHRKVHVQSTGWLRLVGSTKF